MVSYLADNALTYAGGSVLGDSVRSEYKINYLRPTIGEILIAKASVISAGKRQAVCQCQVIAIAEGEERMVAVAQGTITKAGDFRDGLDFPFDRRRIRPTWGLSGQFSLNQY